MQPVKPGDPVPLDLIWTVTHADEDWVHLEAQDEHGRRYHVRMARETAEKRFEKVVKH